MSDESKYVMFRIGEGWSALYVDGSLDQIGDSYNVEERIAELLGVSLEESEVMARVSHRSDAPSTLANLREQEAELAERQQRANALRDEADRLRRQADSMDGGDK